MKTTYLLVGEIAYDGDVAIAAFDDREDAYIALHNLTIYLARVPLFSGWVEGMSNDIFVEKCKEYDAAVIAWKESAPFGYRCDLGCYAIQEIPLIQS